MLSKQERVACDEQISLTQKNKFALVYADEYADEAHLIREKFAPPLDYDRQIQLTCTIERE
jgi:hypothetical protein